MKIFKARQMYLLFIVILSVFSITGCGGGGSDGQAPVLGSGDAVIAPTVTAVAPLNNATGVPINTKIITAAFSKAMAPATLTTASFTLAQGGTVVAGGTVTYVTTGNVATLTLPATDLLASTLYTATITTAATDTTGTPLASNYVWTFTTGAAVDVTLPRVTITVPATATPNPTNVPTNMAITAVFTEDMAPATISSPATSFTVRNTTLGSPGTLVSGTVSYAVGSRTAVFTPAAVLAASNTYTATITTAATDLAGNQLAGNQAALPAASDYVWSWSTAAAVVIPPVVAVDTTLPIVVSTIPVNGTTGVPLNQSVSATFSEPMDPLTMTNLIFTVTGAGLPVPGGLVSYDPLSNIATFRPDANLAPSTTYTGTITTGAKDLAGNALASNYVWTFTTDAAGTGLAPGAVNLGSASTFGIMATSAITNTGFSTINGDVSLDPGTSMTGFPPGVVNGSIHINDAVSAQARADLLVAYNFAKTLPPGTTIAAGADLGALYPLGLPPGTYTSGSTMLVSTPLVLDAGGNADAVWIFQIGSSLTTGASVSLANGAQAKNVFWVPTSDATIGVGTIFSGTIVAGRDTTGVTGAVINGRILTGAITAGTIALDTNTVNVPAP
ncbi:MAG: Ig-like domain-containing protein [Desulfobulbia bacterium]